MQTRFVGTILFLMALSACSPAVQPPTLPPATDLPVAETPASSGETTDACPAETADLKLFTNANDGYCFLYPAEDAALPPYLVVINPNGNPGDEPGDAWAQVSMEDAAGRSAAQAADAQIAEAGGGFEITRSEILMGGQPAVVVDGLPGPDSWRKVFVVGNGRLYTLVFMPWAPNADWFPPLEKLYSSVVNSFHFLPPAQ